jgi:putative transposase
MSNSFSSLFVHLVFSTKFRAQSLAKEVRPELHAYLGGITQNTGSTPVIFNSVIDHLHGLVLMARDKNISDLVSSLKRSSNAFLRERFPTIIDDSFLWQVGYGAYSVSYSAVPNVERYIADQESHHASFSYEDEIRLLVRKNRIQIDEKYLFD